MLTYIEKIQALSHQNKYLKWYSCICQRALQRANNIKDAKNLLIDVEKHHILPVSIGILEDSKDIRNIAFLTVREHFVVHLLLVRFLKEHMHIYKMNSAITRFFQGKNRKKILTSREYEFARSAMSKWQTDPIRTKKISDSRKAFDPEKKKRLKAIIGAANSIHRSNKIWITNEIEDSQILKDASIPDGWRRGQKKKGKWSESRRKVYEMFLESLTAEDRKKLFAHEKSSESKDRHTKKMKNKRWVNKNSKSIMVDLSDVDEYLKNGYSIGRKNKN